MVILLATVLLFQTVTFSPIVAQSSNTDTKIPGWFKSNAKWWKDGKISDQEIINAIENLLSRKIIKLDSSKIKSTTAALESSSPLSPKADKRISGYVKNIFALWEEGSVSDSDVANAIKFLIEENIIITSSSSIPKTPRQLAVIIDQIHQSIPNQHFQNKAQQYLKNAGYDVDLYTTNDVTIDFLKKLPSMNYKFIIFRTHSLEDPESENPTFLFTGEKYNINNYIQEQLFGQIAKGVPLYEQDLAVLSENKEYLSDKLYFVVGSKFVDELMVGKFPDSVIIIGGCESARNNDLGISLVNRGASSVIGWDRTVGSPDNDQAILSLLDNILIKKMEVRDAVLSVNDEFLYDPIYSPQLRYIYR